MFIGHPWSRRLAKPMAPNSGPTRRDRMVMRPGYCVQPRSSDHATFSASGCYGFSRQPERKIHTRTAMHAAMNTTVNPRLAPMLTSPLP